MSEGNKKCKLWGNCAEQTEKPESCSTGCGLYNPKNPKYMGGIKAKRKSQRRSGADRRKFDYAICGRDKRSGGDRRKLTFEKE